MLATTGFKILKIRETKLTFHLGKYDIDMQSKGSYQKIVKVSE